MESSDEDGLGDDYDEKMEFSKEVLALLKKERKKLKEAGLDVDFMISEIERLLQEALDSKARVDDLKKQLLMSMSESLIGRDDATHPSDERLDMAAKGVRKDEDVLEYFKRVLRQTRSPDGESKNT